MTYDMKNVRLVLRRALLMIALVSPLGLFAQGREVVNLNFDWYFHLGDLNAVPTALPAADAAGWERIDVPHDYQIAQPWVEPSPEERPNDGHTHTHTEEQGLFPSGPPKSSTRNRSQWFSVVW